MTANVHNVRDKTSLVSKIFIKGLLKRNQKLSLADDVRVKEKTGRRA